MTDHITRAVPALILAALALAGCETTTVVEDDVDQVDQYNDMAKAYNDLRSDVQAMQISGAEMPTVGSATYTGYATILADTQRDTALVGDARLTADFTSSTLTGNLTNFVGTVDGSDYDDFNGSVAIKEGDIGDTSASSIDAEMKGSLSSGEDLVEVNGGLTGNFRTDGAINAAGLTAGETSDTTFTVNGEVVDGDMGVVAIR